MSFNTAATPYVLKSEQDPLNWRKNYICLCRCEQVKLCTEHNSLQSAGENNIIKENWWELYEKIWIPSFVLQHLEPTPLPQSTAL